MGWQRTLHKDEGGEMSDLYDPQIDGCEYRKEWICKLDGDYCDSNIQIGLMCPNRKPPKEKGERENGKA